MPSGDAPRTWFPEMIVRLWAEWHAGMSMPALIGLQDELDVTFRRVRAGRNIQTPNHLKQMWVNRACGGTHVSERALIILVLGRFEITAKDQSRALEKECEAYRSYLMRATAG